MQPGRRWRDWMPSHDSRTPLTLESYCRRHGVEVSDEVVLAASYLQAIGYRFAIEFGIDNAVAIAEIVYCHRTGAEP